MSVLCPYCLAEFDSVGTWQDRAEHDWTQCSIKIVKQQRAELAQLRETVERMRRALEAAKVAFQGYEVHHRVKGADAKAETNRKLAEMCLAAAHQPAAERRCRWRLFRDWWRRT